MSRKSVESVQTGSASVFLHSFPDRIDIHTHILPGVDDGARNLTESVELAVLASRQGIGAVIATPHGSFGKHRRSLREDYERLLLEVRQEVKKELPDFEIYLGQEHLYREGLEEKLLSGEALTLAGSGYVLVEFAPETPYAAMNRGLRNLTVSGYTPVLAHIERYGCLRDEKNLKTLREGGCLFQMNYASLSGNFLDKDVRWCRKQVREGRLHFLGTDLHRTDYRPPEILPALRWLENHVELGYLEKLMGGNGAKILQDSVHRSEREKN